MKIINFKFFLHILIIPTGKSYLPWKLTVDDSFLNRLIIERTRSWSPLSKIMSRYLSVFVHGTSTSWNTFYTSVGESNTNLFRFIWLYQFCIWVMADVTSWRFYNKLTSTNHRIEENTVCIISTVTDRYKYLVSNDYKSSYTKKRLSKLIFFQRLCSLLWPRPLVGSGSTSTIAYWRLHHFLLNVQRKRDCLLICLQKDTLNYWS